MVDIINKILARLPEFYSSDETTTTYQLLYSIALELETIYSEMDNLTDEIFIDTATSTYLNALGRIFRLSRNADESDSDFRARIKGYWPGFSGGGTIDAFKQTINRITGVSEDNITVSESDFMKIIVDIVLDEDYSIASTIIDLLQQINAAGVYVASRITLAGDLLTETLGITDIVTITPGGTGVFTAGVSIAGGSDVA